MISWDERKAVQNTAQQPVHFCVLFGSAHLSSLDSIDP